VLRRLGLVAALAGLFAAGSGAALAGSNPNALNAPSSLTARVGARSVELAWQPGGYPPGVTSPAVVVNRDGAVIATLAPSATSYSDSAVTTGARHVYTVADTAVRGSLKLSSPPSNAVGVQLPAYLVGAAIRDITPSGVINLGGFGFGDGSTVVSQQLGPGSKAGPNGNHIWSRAMVVSDGRQTVALAVIETQGYFVAYESGPYGLEDMADQVAADTHGALPMDHMIIASDHTHHGPDTIGVWGGVTDDYLRFVKQQTVAAIEAAYAGRRFASIRAGQSEASDLIYNQSCPEALNQSRTPTYTGPDACATSGKDGKVRVVQAVAPDGAVVVTQMVYAAHSTTNMGSAIDGDWPQFLGDYMAASFGGVGIGMEGANGGTQPCRPTCSFTNPDPNQNPGYTAPDRFTAIRLNYMARVRDALAHASWVTGPVTAARAYIREPVDGPFAAGLLSGGADLGAPIMRNHESPWIAAQTVRTVASAVRIGSLLYAGTPGEGYPAIRSGVESAVPGASMVIQLGLADDQLGYLIAPASYAPAIYAEVAVNDNALFNVSPTIGDHVMCADIVLALSLGLDGSSPATCAAYDAEDLANDAAGDPVGQLPVGGVVAPPVP
jgi:hypothetical protein